MKYIICIPTINRADILNPTLNNYISRYPQFDFNIIDNGNQRLVTNERIQITKSNKNLGVAGSWNKLLTESFKTTDFAIVLNDDVEIEINENDLINIFNTLDQNIFYCCNGFQCFIISKLIFEKVGPFDEQFYPAYYEDADYHNRLKLLNYPLAELDLKLKTHGQSSSIKKDPSLSKDFNKLKELYIKKWGKL